MKKFFAAVCAAVMVLGSTFTAFAAPSATADDVTMGSAASLVAAIDKNNTVSADGKDVTVKTASSESVAALEDAVVDILQDKNTDSTSYKAEVMAVADIEIDGANGGTVTIAVPAVKKGDTIIVLHWNGKWESASVSNVKVENGKVTATFGDLSPVAIVKIAEKAPKGGVGVSTLSLIAAAGLAGAVVCGKKKSN